MIKLYKNTTREERILRRLPSLSSFLDPEDSSKPSMLKEALGFAFAKLLSQNLEPDVYREFLRNKQDFADCLERFAKSGSLKELLDYLYDKTDNLAYRLSYDIGIDAKGEDRHSINWDDAVLLEKADVLKKRLPLGSKEEDAALVQLFLNLDWDLLKVLEHDIHGFIDDATLKRELTALSQRGLASHDYLLPRYDNFEHYVKYLHHFNLLPTIPNLNSQSPQDAWEVYKLKGSIPALIEALTRNARTSLTAPHSEQPMEPSDMGYSSGFQSPNQKKHDTSNIDKIRDTQKYVIAKKCDQEFIKSIEQVYEVNDDFAELQESLNIFCRLKEDDMEKISMVEMLRHKGMSEEAIQYLLRIIKEGAKNTKERVVLDSYFMYSCSDNPSPADQDDFWESLKMSGLFKIPK